MTEATIDASTEVQGAEAQEPSKLKRIFKTIGWIGFAAFLLIGFTLIKLPEDRVRDFANGQISSLLSQQGIGFTARTGKISLLLGLRYEMEDVTLRFPGNADPVRIESVSVSPAWLKLFTGKLGGTLRIKNGEGKIVVTAAYRGQLIDLSVNSKEMDLAKLGVFSLVPVSLAALSGYGGEAAGPGLQAGAMLSGQADLTGDLANPASLNGEIVFDLKKIQINDQNIAGFNLPKLNIASGKIDLKIAQGKASFRSFHLGKDGGSDDLIATLSGDAQLTKALDMTNLNLKAKLKFSKKVHEAITLIDTFMAAAKDSSGFYSYALSGPLGSIVPQPAP